MRKTCNHLISLFLAVLTFSLPSTLAMAQTKTLCVRRSLPVRANTAALSKAITVVSGTKCPSGFKSLLATSSFTGPAGATGATGAAGAAGAAGATGSAGATGAIGATGATGVSGATGAAGTDYSPYGDGSAGAYSATTTELLTDRSLALRYNNNFSSITVANAANLGIFRGQDIIRSTGACTVGGTISVGELASPGLAGITSTGIPVSRDAQPSFLNSRALPGFPAAIGSVAASSLVAADVLAPFSAGSYLSRLETGGGAGAGAGGYGGFGGGTITLICAGPVQIAGSILAPASSGNNGGGGGAGGVIRIFSATSISVTGTINVSGGAGGASTTISGSGGGGCGGLVYLMAPSISNSGTITLTGGAAGSNSISANAPYRVGGASGGSSVGFGGTGGQVNSNNTVASAFSGGIGSIITVTADPTALLGDL